MAFLLSWLGVVVSLGFIASGAVMNWRYGLGIGRTEADQQLSAVAHLLIDVCKVMMPFFGWWAWAQRRYIVALMAGTITCAAVTYSAIGIAGYVNMNRQLASGGLLAKKDNVDDWRAEIARIDARLKLLGTVEPASVLEQRLDKLRQDRRWTSTNGCSDATAGASRDYCRGYNELEAQQASARELEKLEHQKQAIRDKVNALAGVAAIEKGDPRADIVVEATGWDLRRVQTWLSLLFVGIVEFMATFGIFLSLNHGELARVWTARRERLLRATDDHRPVSGPVAAGRAAAPAGAREPDVQLIEHQPVGRIIQFIAAETEPNTGGIDRVDLHAHYVRWCVQSGLSPLNMPAFEREFDEVRQLPTIGHRVSKFGTRYIGIGIAGSPSKRRARR